MKWQLQGGRQRRCPCLVCFVGFGRDSHSGYVFYNLLKCPGVCIPPSLSFFFLFFLFTTYIMFYTVYVTHLCTCMFLTSRFLLSDPSRTLGMCSQLLSQQLCMPAFLLIIGFLNMNVKLHCSTPSETTKTYIRWTVSTAVP